MKECHFGSVEIIPGLFLGSLEEAYEMPFCGVTTLMPLCFLDGTIWETGFRGEIVYYPIEDYGVLPDEVLSEAVSAVMDRLRAGGKVGLFSMAGHGRTGYVAAAVLGRMGYLDPIGFLRERYCKNAVESEAQIKHLARVLGRPELREKYCLRKENPPRVGGGPRYA